MKPIVPNRGGGLIATVALACAGCSPVAPTPPGAVFDAGPVIAEDTPKLVHRFDVVNTTGRPVALESERHSCDCTEVDFAPRTLAPGESMPLKLDVRVPGGRAAMRPSCTLTTDHPDFPEWTYELRFEAFARIAFTPDRIDLGSAELAAPGKSNDVPATGQCRLEYVAIDGPTPPPDPRITAPEGVEATIGRPTVERVGDRVTIHRYPLALHLDGPPRRAGSFSPLLYAFFGEDQPPRTATVAWRVTAPIEFAPAQVHFGVVGPGDPERRQAITLRSSKGEPFRILAIDGGAGGPKLEVPGGPPSASAAEHRLGIAFALPPNTETPALAGTVRVETDHPASPDVELPWSAFVRRAEGRAATGPPASPSATE